MRGTEKPGVLIYWEMSEALKRLSAEQLHRFFPAMIDYARFGEVTDFSDDPMLDFAWTLVQSKIDNDTQRYEKKRMRNKENGFASEFVRSYAPAHGIDPNDAKEKAAYIKRRMAEEMPE